MKIHLTMLLLWTGCATEPESAVIDTTPRVEVIAVAEAPSSIERTLLSSLEARRDALLTPMRPGRVVARPAPPGSKVAEGDPILVLDDREARANLATAKAARAEAEAVLSEAQRQLARVKALGDGASGAQQDQAQVGVDRASAAADRARAQVDLAAVNVDHMTLRAPFAGEVALLDPEVGESVGAGVPAARVVDTSSTRVVVGLLEDEVLAANDPRATFEVRADARSVPATLAYLAPAADPRTLDWRAELDVEGLPFPAGTPVEVVLRLPVDAVDGLVPPRAVEDDHVWVIDEGVARHTEVEVVGEVRGGLLVRGVPVGTNVVLHAAEPLQDGTRVELLEAP